MTNIYNKIIKKLNTYLKMDKKLIRLTESDIHRIVKESVNRVLNEVNGLYTNENGDGVYDSQSVYSYFKELTNKYGEKRLLKLLFQEIGWEKMYGYLNGLDVERDIHGNKTYGNTNYNDSYEQHQEMRGPFGSM